MMRAIKASLALATGLLFVGCDSPVVGTYFPQDISLINKITFTSTGYVDVTSLGLYSPAASKYVVDGNRIIVKSEGQGQVVFLIDERGCITEGGVFGGTYCKNAKIAASSQTRNSPAVVSQPSPPERKVAERTLGITQSLSQQVPSNALNNSPSGGAPHFIQNTAPAASTLNGVLSRLRDVTPFQSNSPRNTVPESTASGEAKAVLSAADRGAISDHLRECWTEDKAGLDYDKYLVHLILTTDANGVIRQAAIAINAAYQKGNGAARAYAERVRRAALDPQCAHLSLPNAMIGQIHTFEITF